MDYQAFYDGRNFEAYTYFGAHKTDTGILFRTYAPAASRIELIGDFNNWQGQDMNRVYNGAFWELEVPQAKNGDKYKYRIYKGNGSYVEHSDPYGTYAELRPATASIISDLPEYPFEAPSIREQGSIDDRPMHTYEVHLGSWRKPDSEPASWYTYREIADKLVPYVKAMHYNFLEIMPLAEYPCDESWGYQETGYFAPTSRYGDPQDLKYLVDLCHKNGIGVILDFVPVHFAVNDYALFNYDGTPLYEYPNDAVSHSEWGSCNFMHSRGEVRSFLNSAAAYWIREFNFDGLRLDAVSNLIYWQGNASRGINNNTIGFIKEFNSTLKQKFPGIILIAEDSSSYQGVTTPVDQGGLGFDLKWDLGWMNDTLRFMKEDAAGRANDLHAITFSMHYFYNEKYILPFSHDEVVHGKGTILNKMHGESTEEKMKQLRLLYMYMMAHPGKKLNFMGNELAQLLEWSERRELSWDLLETDLHAHFHSFFASLNQVYLANSALWQKDFDKDGFAWIDCFTKRPGICSFIRRSDDQQILVILNFTDQKEAQYKLNFEQDQQLSMLFDSFLDPHKAYAWKEANLPEQPGKEFVFALPADSAFFLEMKTIPQPETPKAAEQPEVSEEPEESKI